MPSNFNLYESINDCARTISQQPIGRVPYLPETWAKPMECFLNTRRKVEINNGKIQFGWMFQSRQVESMPEQYYLIAVHHAVWYAPDGHLIDITPFHENPKHQPIVSNNDVIFLVDDQAMPALINRIDFPLPSKFFPLSKDKELADYVEYLNKKEEYECKKIK